MYCLCISYKIAPIQVREKFAFSRQEAQRFCQQLVSKEIVSGCVILSTCNRSEIYFTGSKKALEQVEEALAQLKAFNLSQMLTYVMVYEGEKMVRHLYQVASGLDSMVIGEDEILGQVKTAYQESLENKTTDTTLNIIFQGAICSARKVKEATGLSKTAISVGTLVAHEIFHFDKEEKAVLLIGLTSKIGSIIAKDIYKDSSIHMIGTTRQHGYEPSWLLGQKIVPYQARYDYLDEADIVISATSSPHYTLTYDVACKVIHQKKKRLFIDLAVPSDMDKHIQRIEGLQLYDMDHFECLSRKNNALKLKAVEKGNMLLEEEVSQVLKKVYLTRLIKKEALLSELLDKWGVRQLLMMTSKLADQKFLSMLLTLIQKAEDEKNINEKKQ